MKERKKERKKGKKRKNELSIDLLSVVSLGLHKEKTTQKGKKQRKQCKQRRTSFRAKEHEPLIST